MSMSRKDYEAVAEAVRVTREARPFTADDALDVVTAMLADAFERGNERFDRYTFYAATTPKEK